MHKLAWLTIVLLAACGGSSSKPATTASTTAPSTTEMAPGHAPVVELAALSFYEGDELGMKLQPDGHLQVKQKSSEAGKPVTEKWLDVASLAADGTLTTEGGKVNGALHADGSFVTADGKTLPFKLEGDTLIAKDQHITVDAKGMLQGGNPMPKPMRVDGASTPGLRRTALLVLALIMTGDAHPAAPASTTATPAS